MLREERFNKHLKRLYKEYVRMCKDDKWHESYDWSISYNKFRCDVLLLKKRSADKESLARRMNCKLTIDKDKYGFLSTMLIQLLVAFLTSIATLFAVDKVSGLDFGITIALGIGIGLGISLLIWIILSICYKRAYYIHFYEEVIRILDSDNQ